MMNCEWCVNPNPVSRAWVYRQAGVEVLCSDCRAIRSREVREAASQT
jgi:hypothetical protein